jgi:hypothetical protein
MDHMSAMMRRSKLLDSRNRFLEDTGIHTFTGEEELIFPFMRRRSTSLKMVLGAWLLLELRFTTTR